MMRLTTMIALCALVMACASPPAATPEPTPTLAARSVDYYTRVYGGLAGAYRSILEETNCAAIQELFYTATDNGSTGFQDAAMDRAQDLGCPTLLFNRP